MRTRVIQTGPGPNTAEADPGARGDRAERRPHRGLGAVIAAHPLVAFFGLAFALTWVTVPLGTFMAAGPLLAALVVLGVVEGRAGIRDLGHRMVQWRVGWPWYAAAILVPVGVALAAGGANVAIGASDSAFAQLELPALFFAFALHMVVPVFAPIGEEPGWRGFALPRLQARHNPLTATLILGVIVAVWHAPLIFLSREHFEPVMLLGTVAVTFFYTWLFNHTGGSVFMTIVAHAADGAVAGRLLADGGFHGPAETRFAALYSAAWCVVALTLIVVDRHAWRTPPTDVGSAPRRRAKALPVSGAIAVLAALVIGVVGAGAAGASVAQASSRDRYIERADTVCRHYVEQTDAVVEDLGFAPTDAEARTAAQEIVDLARVELRELRALSVPAADGPRVARIYRAIERAYDRVEAEPHLLVEEPGPFSKATRLADAYGFEVCGRG